LKLPTTVAATADILIDCLDDDGWLRVELADLSAEWDIPVFVLERALKVVQSLEPAGVGCRNLSECLRLQLLALGAGNSLAMDIVANHLEEIADGSFSAEDLGPEELEEAISTIRSLSPRPCANLGKDTTHYIIPEIRIFRDGDALRAELINQPVVPAISPLYKDYLKAESPEDRIYVRRQLALAKSFIRSLSMRTRTLQGVADLLASRQADFFLLGPEHQKILPLSDAARTLGLSVSTISRAVTGKYAEFEGSVFALRDLFCSNGVGEFSRSAVIVRIQSLLSEDPSYSDGKLASMLATQGIRISRRAVNKYRHMAPKRK